MKALSGEWFTVDDEVLSGNAQSGPVSDDLCRSDGREPQLRVVLQCREVDRPDRRKRQYRVRLTQVVATNRKGKPVAESFYFQACRGNLDLLQRTIGIVGEQVERHAAGELDGYVEMLRARGVLADGPSNIVDFQIV